MTQALTSSNTSNTSTASGVVTDVTGIPDVHVRGFIRYWAGITRPDRIEIIDAADDGRLLAEALAAGELLPAGEGRYYARSHPADTARSEDRTVVATADPADAGRYNNWRPADEVKAELLPRLAGASRGKTMYVVPYLMAVPDGPLTRHAVGVELTDDRTVVLQMIRMARVSRDILDNLGLSGDPSYFVRGVHVTGDLDSLGQGTDDDRRLFATLADERTIIHYGSAYGGNALLGKIAHALRLASYDGQRTGDFLAEQFMLLGIEDTATGKTWHVAGGFPSASGKTNLAMTLPPDALGDRYRVTFYGDDIAWMWPGADGRLYAMNPENGAFGVARDTNSRTNPAAMEAIRPGTGTIFTNVAYNEVTQDVWWEGLTPAPPADLTGWRDWTGALIADRPADAQDAPWAHPNSRFTTALSNVTTLAPDAGDPAGVPVDLVIFGGRTRDREPLARVVHGDAAGVYDGLTLGAEATFAAEGLDGQLRYDPMSMRPFLSYPEGRYAQHWLDILGRLTEPPTFAHVNWFQRDPEDGHYRWPGFRENLRVLLWLLAYRDGAVTGTPSPVGTLPTADELDLTGLGLPDADLAALLSVDTARWETEMRSRAELLAGFPGLPDRIRQAHRDMAAALAAQA
jgi:phosphoenolpyruvate carboxykinase (GTP)